MKLEEAINHIFCTDCLKLMSKLPSESIDLIITSPPYNIGRKGKLKAKNYKSKVSVGYSDYDDCRDQADYEQWQHQCLEEMFRLLKPDGAIFYNHKFRIKDGKLLDHSHILKEMPVRQMIIWHKNSFCNFNDHFFVPCYEVIYMIAKPQFRLRPHANGCGDVWNIPKENKVDHPAPFPVELPKRIIQSTTAKLVLDPFCGSGSTLVAAKQLGIDYIGCDISPTYCGIAQGRVQQCRFEKLFTTRNEND